MAFVPFGIQHFVYAQFAAGLGPPWFPGRPLWAYLTGAVFLVAGATIFLEKKARMAATLLGTMLLLFFALLDIPRITVQLHDPGPWTSGFDVLALCGGALVLANTLPRENRE